MAEAKLSYEKIMEIILCASLKTLDMIRCTNKELNTLMYLLDLYMKRNKIVSGFIIPSTQCIGSKYDINEFAPYVGSISLYLSFLPYNAQILTTSDEGLIVFRIYDPYCRNYFHNVCKPSTKQVSALSDLEVKNHMNQKFAFVVLSLNSLHYKIVKLSDDRTVRRWGKLCGTYSCDVFDLAKWQWRSLNHIMFRYCVNLMIHDPQITNCGSVYMLLTYNDVFKFDVHSEKWTIIASLFSYEINTNTSPLVEIVKYVEGQGWLVNNQPHGDGCCWEIWVLIMSTDQELWEKVHVFKEKCGRGRLKAVYDSDTSGMVNNDTLMYYMHKQEGNTIINKVVLRKALIVKSSPSD